MITSSEGEDKEGGREAALLPAFVSKDQDGIYVDLSYSLVDGVFADFIDQLFSSGTRFSGLDYPAFIAMLYDSDPISAGKIRIAEDTVRFPPQRQELYKGLKILEGGVRAEYVFEPVSMEITTEEPVYGEPGEDGTAIVVDHIRRGREQPTRLDFDEFVASLWLKGVRFGIDVEAVRAAIIEGSITRIQVATQRDAVPGRDADIQAANEGLQRDDSPKVLANGRTDLKRFKNRFPHVAKDEPLVRKAYRVAGKLGRKVTGEPIEPYLPQDLDLFPLAGPGTYIKQSEGEDLIVAAMDGFLTLDLATNQVSVTEKIENRDGISARTTGDLALAVDEFIEHGEVQEGRAVEGRHMTFKSDVFGNISALNGGNIHFESNLSGGNATSSGGSIRIDGRASRAMLEAWDGSITAQFAEGCTIMAKTVSIAHAINCEIVAEELSIGAAEGCGIFAKSVRAESADMRKNQESVITMVVPDLSAYDEAIAARRKTLSDIATAIAEKTAQAETLKGEPELTKFLALREQIKQGRIQLTDAQFLNWQKIESKFARTFRLLQTLDAECQALAGQSKTAEQEIDRLSRERAASGADVSCEITEVRGETIVQTAVSSLGINALRVLGLAELKARLHGFGAAEDRLFSGDGGTFAWRYTVPELQ